MDKPILKAKDFASDQDLRWCPGCGDFAILKQVQNILPKIGAKQENTVFISGIGCSSRFPYYMNTYGMHSIHGRAAAIASGLRLTREDLDIWVITGDGDSLSIGGNHLIHLLRRDLNINVLLFNNEIYGLTKGQYSPTSKQNTKTKSSPFGSVEEPFNTLALSLGAGASFVARSIDREAKHLQEMLMKTHQHQGTSFLEIYQNCHIFNDGTFSNYTDRKAKKINTLFLENGKPLIFGENNEFGIILVDLTPRIVKLCEIDEEDLWIHDEQNKMKALILANYVDLNPAFPKLFGIIFSEGESNSTALSGKDLIELNYMDNLLAGDKTWHSN